MLEFASSHLVTSLLLTVGVGICHLPHTFLHELVTLLRVVEILPALRTGPGPVWYHPMVLSVREEHWIKKGNTKYREIYRNKVWKPKKSCYLQLVIKHIFGTLQFEDNLSINRSLSTSSPASQNQKFYMGVKTIVCCCWSQQCTGCSETSCKFLRLVTQSFFGLFPGFWAFLYYKLVLLGHEIEKKVDKSQTQKR